MLWRGPIAASRGYTVSSTRMSETSSGAAHNPGQRQLRDRLFPWLSILVAGACAWGTGEVAHRVREYNSNRAVGGLLVASMMSGAATRPASGVPAVHPRTGLPWISFPPAPASMPGGPSPARDSDRPGLPPVLPVRELTRATASAEGIILVWERIGQATAALLLLAGLSGLVTRRVRAAHLVVAAVLLAGTVATLAAMRLLVDPARGAFHPLPAQSYVLAALIQSAYGWILLAAFARPAPGRIQPPSR
jgi:hypothetical protein